MDSVELKLLITKFEDFRRETVKEWKLLNSRMDSIDKKVGNHLTEVNAVIQEMRINIKENATNIKWIMLIGGFVIVELIAVLIKLYING